MSEIAEPIRELVKEKVPFNWGPEHEESFTMLKREMNEAPVLAYCNPWKETVLQTDTSIKGLGACLLQEEKPVYFASKALTETQRGYVAIEIESLAVAWAVEKFHHFLYGCHFMLETDQKPLEAILSRSLNQATPRLQYILIKMLPYNFTVRYIPGLRNLLADCLSRNILSNYPNCMYIRSHNNYQPEVTNCRIFNKLLKLMMSLLCSNIPLWQDGPIPLRKYQQFYTHIGHFMKNSP